MENLDEIKQSYQLSEEELNNVGKIIYDKYTYNKGSSNRPFAIIVIGQPGAGKSGLMGYSENQFETAISLDIDDLRAYHPKHDDVAEKYPTIFEEVTGGFASQMIHYLTPRLIANKHNLILHKTRGDDAVIYDTIIPLQQKGYDIILRVLAVNHLESKMSALERSLAQREKFDYCRWVRIPYHNTQYEGIPVLTEKFEQGAYADHIEVFTRGKIPVWPELQYSTTINEKILTNPHMKTESGNLGIGEYNPNGYTSSRDAVNKAREIAVPEILEKIDERLAKAKAKATKGDEGEYIDEIAQIAEGYRSKLKLFD